LALSPSQNIETGRLESAPKLEGLNVLVVRLSALGDVTRTMPSVLALIKRFPTARFTWLVESNSAGLLKGIPNLEILEIDRKALRSGGPLAKIRAFSKVISDIKSHRFDLSIDFHGVLKSAILPFLARIPIRVGYEKGFSKEGARWFLTHRYSGAFRQVSRYGRNEMLAKWLAPGLEVEPIGFALDVAAKEKIRHAMSDQPIILFPGTSAHGRNKRWPAASWAALFRRLHTEHKTVFAFGPADEAYREALRELLADIPGGLPVLPSFRLTEMAGALGMAKVFVSCDTGPMHMASVQGVPIVALMGPSDSVLNQPWKYGKSRMVIPEAPCAPCRNRKCPILICQDMTTPAMAHKAILELCDSLSREGSKV
jgi:ADP-heptose:LPS heptosyltransferase